MAEDADAVTEAPLGASERRTYEARIAESERRRQSVEALNRFQIQAYKARLAELKRAEARHLADKRRLERRLEALAEEVRRLGSDARGAEE